MRNRFLSCADQLRHLMETHNPKLKNAADLSRAMHEMGIFEYSDKPGITKEESIRYKARTINSHLDGRQIDIGFLIAYCDFFHCSADYLLGYISSPTHAATDIVEETGLWEESLKVIEGKNDLTSEFLNSLILSENFYDICSIFEALIEAIYTRNEFDDKLRDCENRIQKFKDKGEKIPFDLLEDYYEAGGFCGGHGNGNIYSVAYMIGIKFGTFLENFKDKDIEFINRLYWGKNDP